LRLIEQHPSPPDDETGEGVVGGCLMGGGDGFVVGGRELDVGLEVVGDELQVSARHFDHPDASTCVHLNPSQHPV
jgi:hypothetical protein